MTKIAGLEILEQYVKDLTDSAGVYRMIGDNEQILYVGKAKNLKKRVTSYCKFSKLPNRLKKMVSEIKKIEIVKTDSEIEALILELNLIKTLKPIYNIMLRDDKTYPYIYFSTHHDYPAIYSYRGHKKSKGKYFGPFVGGYDVEKTVNLLKKSFLIRSCSDNEFKNRTKPCLEYQIKRCSAPCVNYITKEDYQKLLKETYNFLTGKKNDVREKLILAMEEASKKYDFERAAILRDRIKAIKNITAKQDIADHKLVDTDAFAIIRQNSTVIIEHFIFRNGFNNGNQHFFPKNIDGLELEEILTNFIKQYYHKENIVKEIITNIELEESKNLAAVFFKEYQCKTQIINPKLGRKKKVLNFIEINAKYHLEKKTKNHNKNLTHHQKIQKIFKLDKTPNKIEVFDNSHISGTNSVGAMIVSDLNGFNKNCYRKFNIKFAHKADDFDMLREVLQRRYTRLISEDPDNKNNSWPDLIIIDGGKGQASIAAKIFAQLNLSINFFCIAKGEFRNKGLERFCNHLTDYFSITHKETLYYLQRIRDEAHRFAIETHRKKRNKSSLSSQLDQIPGIGPKKKQDLLKYFGSVANIRSASKEDLAKVKNINITLAEKLLEFLK